MNRPALNPNPNPNLNLWFMVPMRVKKTSRLSMNRQSQKDWLLLSLSLGERAGVRASVSPTDRFGIMFHGPNACSQKKGCSP